MLSYIVEYMKRLNCNHTHNDGRSAWVLKSEGERIIALSSDIIVSRSYYYLYICEKCLQKRKIKI